MPMGCNCMREPSAELKQVLADALIDSAGSKYWPGCGHGECNCPVRAQEGVSESGTFNDGEAAK